MRFAPKTPQEIAAEKAKFGAWPRGTYDFEVMSAEDSVSKNGNDMIVLEVSVFDRNGNRRSMKDWLVEAMPVKLKEAHESVGLHEAYNEGKVSAHDFVGRTGQLTLAIEKNPSGDDRNKISGYIPSAKSIGVRARSANMEQRARAPGNADLEDSIPF